MKDKVVKQIRRVVPKSTVHSLEEGYRKGRVKLLQAKYGFPARGLRVIAVTGTNGKTTTCAYINAMLKSAGYTTALFTTAFYEMKGKKTANRLHRTVPLTAELMQFLGAAKANKVDFVILETTSMALDQHKLIGIPIEVAVMTNLTQDHLDYHGTMENYAASKARLFNHYMRPKTCVLNADDQWLSYFKKQSSGTVTTYGVDGDSDVTLHRMELTASGISAEVLHGHSQAQLKSVLVGRFNLYNALAAVSTGLQVGLSLEQACKGVGALESVDGRMEAVNAGQNFSVIVDYAHAPDALENVLKTLQELTKGKVMVVFGGTGNRDTTKRVPMGTIAAKHADHIFLTDDEPYQDDPAAIRREVMQGITAGKGASKTTEIGDRTEAIKAAFTMAKKGDVVLLAGLGHQDYREMNEGKVAWDDRQVARKLLKKYIVKK